MKSVSARLSLRLAATVMMLFPLAPSAVSALAIPVASTFPDGLVLNYQTTVAPIDFVLVEANAVFAGPQAATGACVGYFADLDAVTLISSGCNSGSLPGGYVFDVGGGTVDPRFTDGVFSMALYASTEGWSLQDLSVTVATTDGGRYTLTPLANHVPLPATVALLGLGLLGLVGFQRNTTTSSNSV